ncbi:NO-inducible flavohemoprotein [Marinibactrum halimedae]|uniref:Flavohemoprotein n=1 Tax=Marinibactrum halimedae TaxID=1444977 RepID=A0AA37T4V5_9GAMM|nr:NO-inducible flavohemoprotein [Marinibactrum halimedae]MCD9460651.1 NO-inducible flavohemoprotein [Marinibactrum halimedae]GLS24296.1 flavohemoprotein [Marinibactrum halimedae]
MLSTHVIETVKSTIPLLEQVGPAITEHFYERMFRLNPELKHVFNMSHQHSGKQRVALFNAIAAYAKHIDNLPVLKEAVERIANKHTSFNIQPAQYQIVGHHLIETLRELAGEAFTPTVEEAWTQAYQFLAGVFIDRESALYQQNQAGEGGWEGPRRFILTEKRMESELVKSFVFEPEDGKSVLDYQPGQYIGIRVKVPGQEYDEVRQYSLSSSANGESYQISVKREIMGVPGIVSNYLHDGLRLGEAVELFAPAGDFYFNNHHRPVVLISAGVGLTPMMSIAETLAAESYQQPVWFLHACENLEQQSFRKRIITLSKTLNLEVHTWYKRDHVDVSGSHHGLMDLSTLEETLPLLEGDYYLCGPVPFMQFAKQQLITLGVPENQIYYEVFGPHEDF